MLYARVSLGGDVTEGGHTLKDVEVLAEYIVGETAAIRTGIYAPPKASKLRLVFVHVENRAKTVVMDKTIPDDLLLARIRPIFGWKRGSQNTILQVSTAGKRCCLRPNGGTR